MSKKFLNGLIFSFLCNCIFISQWTPVQAYNADSTYQCSQCVQFDGDDRKDCCKYCEGTKIPFCPEESKK